MANLLGRGERLEQLLTDGRSSPLEHLADGRADLLRERLPGLVGRLLDVDLIMRDEDRFHAADREDRLRKRRSGSQERASEVERSIG